VTALTLGNQDIHAAVAVILAALAAVVVGTVWTALGSDEGDE